MKGRYTREEKIRAEQKGRETKKERKKPKKSYPEYIGDIFLVSGSI